MRLTIGFRDAKMTEIYEILYQMGVGPNQITFFYTACAVRLVLENPEALLFVTKDLYPEVAKRCGSNRGAVGNGIRHVVDRIWRDCPEMIAREMGGNLNRKPTPAEFLIMIARKVQFARAASVNTVAFSQSDAYFLQLAGSPPNMTI